MTEHEQLSKDLADLKLSIAKVELAVNVLADVIKELIKIDIYVVDKTYGENIGTEAVEVKQRVWLAADTMGLCDEARCHNAERNQEKD